MRNELAKRHPEFQQYIERLEETIAESPQWPVSIFVPAYDIWWSHLLTDDESIPHMRVFHAFDDEEVRFLTIVPVD